MCSGPSTTVDEVRLPGGPSWKCCCTLIGLAGILGVNDLIIPSSIDTGTPGIRATGKDLAEDPVSSVASLSECMCSCVITSSTEACRVVWY